MSSYKYEKDCLGSTSHSESAESDLLAIVLVTEVAPISSVVALQRSCCCPSPSTNEDPECLLSLLLMWSVSIRLEQLTLDLLQFDSS